MSLPPPPPQPPVSADCLTVTQLAHPGAQALQTASRMFRSSDGKTRHDSGNTSMITDPAAQQATLLDHVKKEARILPMPKVPPAPPALPGFPAAAPALPAPPAVHVQDLGKGFIEGEEVEGKKYTVQLPQAPKPPAAPAPPSLKPPAPGMPPVPQAPQPPQVPKPPQPETVTSEVWTSTKLHMPVLTKTAGSFGQQTNYYKYATGEPHPSVFQIPPGYKLAMPSPPKPPLPHG